jgi:tRNA threonylcarbamoyladenosine biosynthesis protein TsaE
MATHRSFEARDPTETTEFGRRLGSLAFPGMVIALVGPLGAGKTFLVRAVAEGLLIDNSDVVTSPTFVLVHEYPARLPIYHFDAYRLVGEGEFRDLGVHEYYQAQGVCVIEWADKVVGMLPTEYLDVRIEPTGPLSRRLDLNPYGRTYEELLEKLIGNV